MNSIDRDRMFRDAQEGLIKAISAVVRTHNADPLALMFVLVHRTSRATYEAAISVGATEPVDGFALKIAERDTDPGNPLARIGADEIACMISIDNRHKALGLPLDVLGTVSGGAA